MSKQWGHGFYKGVEAAKAASETLENLFFHTRDANGKIQEQGCVLRALKNGDYLVMLYDWVLGAPFEDRVVEYNAMKTWSFYTSGERMRSRWIMETGGTSADVEWNEKVNKIINGNA